MKALPDGEIDSSDLGLQWLCNKEFLRQRLTLGMGQSVMRVEKTKALVSKTKQKKVPSCQKM